MVYVCLRYKKIPQSLINSLIILPLTAKLLIDLQFIFICDVIWRLNLNVIYIFYFTIIIY